MKLEPQVKSHLQQSTWSPKLLSLWVWCWQWLVLSRCSQTALSLTSTILKIFHQSCPQRLPPSPLRDLQGGQPCLQHHPPCQLRDLRGEEEHLKGQLGTSPLMIKTAGREFARKEESMGKHVGRALLFANTSSIYKCNKYILCITSLIDYFSYFAWYFTLRIYWSPCGTCCSDRPSAQSWLGTKEGGDLLDVEKAESKRQQPHGKAQAGAQGAHLQLLPTSLVAVLLPRLRCYCCCCCHRHCC